MEFRLVAKVTGRCVATAFQSSDAVQGVIRLRAGVGEQHVAGGGKDDGVRLDADQFVRAAVAVGAFWFALAFVSALRLRETFGIDLDYVEKG